MNISSKPLPQQIYKRNGSLQAFTQDKITSAILRAGTATGEVTAQQANELTRTILTELCQTFDKTIPHVEQVRGYGRNRAV
ncbi:ATP cone domain-containing protein [Paludibacterium denitrificans]|nr:ATP cone domain-containing protein [Paludibacterium denitrificans]